MARMHSRKIGKATSKRPAVRKNPSWSRYKEKEIEMLIVKFAKEGNSAAKIGLILRDSYGIPDIKTLFGKSITAILKENKLEGEFPDDLHALIKKAALLARHMESNKQDMSAKRGIQLTEAKINRLVKYYKRIERLPREYKYDRKKIKMFIE